MKMKAAVIRQMGLPQPYADSKPMSIEEVDLDKPGEREVLVQIKAASLCHSDLSSVNGDRPRPMPMILGHEASGIVQEVGPGARQHEDGPFRRLRRAALLGVQLLEEGVHARRGMLGLPTDARDRRGTPNETTFTAEAQRTQRNETTSPTGEAGRT